jgi:regulator of RNase E activity RraA
MTRRRATLLAIPIASALALAGFQAATQLRTMDDPLVAGFKKTTVASVADAVDSVVGSRGYMSHRIRPAVAGQIVGRARTSIVKPAAPGKATPSLSVKHSVEMIDSSRPGEVGVIVMEDGLDVAAIGGLMGTAAKARGMAGIVIDGGVRDVSELRALGLPVYSSSITPATAVGRWASVAKDIPVQCGGVTVAPGDIIVAGEDGIVVVPSARAAEVLKKAQEIDERETKMVPFIKQHRSLTKVIAIFNRI